MATLKELQPLLDAAAAKDGAVLAERIEGGTRYSTVGGEQVGVVDDSPEEKEAAARAALDGDKIFWAKCLSDLAWRLGKEPEALTAGEIRAERDRIAAICKVL